MGLKECTYVNPTGSSFSTADEHPGDDALHRYCLGLASPAEQAEIERWRNGHPASAARIDQLMTLLSQRSVSLSPDDIATGLREIRRKARLEAPEKRPVPVVHLRRPVRRSGWIIGATGVMITLFCTIFSHTTPNRGFDTTYTTPAGREALVTLADGTRLTLSPNAIVRTSHFTAASRRVEVDQGEVFFDVAREASAPFTVQTQRASLQVLGTSFVVRHDRVTGTHVAVLDGKVHLVATRYPGAGVTLSAHQVGDVTDSLNGVNTSWSVPDTEWVQGKLLFHETPVSTVLQTIGQWYGYHFRYTDPTLAERPITFLANLRSSAVTLAKLRQVLGVDLRIVGDTVTLTPHTPVRSKGAPRLPVYDVFTPEREVGR